MGARAIFQQRLFQQRLTGEPFAAPADVVRWLGAVQAQDFAGAKWSLGMRMSAATDAQIEAAFDAGAILRTHVMRPTWHFVAPEDIRGLLALTAPRVHAVNRHMYKRLEIDETIYGRARGVLERALQGGRQLTREELGAALGAAGIEATGQRLGYIAHWAELEALICSGPRRGKQFTYMLLEERAPAARARAHDEALAELTLRFFTGHGPATVRDFAWWSGLTLTDAKKGLDMAGAALRSEQVDDATYWFSASMPWLDRPDPSAFLLPTYDEFLMGYAGESRAGGVDVSQLLFDSMIVVDAEIVGTWRRTVEKGAVVVEVNALPPFKPDDERIAAAAERYAAFVGMPPAFKAVANAAEAKTMGWRRSRLANQGQAGEDA